MEKILEKFSRAQKLTKDDQTIKETCLEDYPDDSNINNNPASGQSSARDLYPT